jgi:hypothetical protein
MVSFVPGCRQRPPHARWHRPQVTLFLSISIFLFLQGGSGKSGIFKIFFKNYIAELNIIQFF